MYTLIAICLRCGHVTYTTTVQNPSEMAKQALELPKKCSAQLIIIPSINSYQSLPGILDRDNIYFSTDEKATHALIQNNF